MGNQSSTESLADTEEITNQINNVSNENCITACDSNISNINMVIEDTTIEGDVNISAVCNILGASCILKAALSNSVQNTQKNQQLAATMQSGSPLLAFSTQNSTIAESNNQDIANQVSNIMNATCQNNSSTSVNGVNVELIGDTIGGSLNINSNGNINKSSCILNNVARTTLANQQTNSQTAKVMQGSPLLFAMLAVVIIIVVVMIGIVILGVGGLGALGIGAAIIHKKKKSSQPLRTKPGMQPHNSQPLRAKPGMQPQMKSYR